MDLDKELPAVDGEIVNYSRFHYLMMNKPAGVVSHLGSNSKTVIDPDTAPTTSLTYSQRDDWTDTEGLLLITNDGQLAHNLCRPKGCSQTYYAEVSGQVSPELSGFRQEFL